MTKINLSIPVFFTNMVDGLYHIKIVKMNEEGLIRVEDVNGNNIILFIKNKKLLMFIKQLKDYQSFNGSYVVNIKDNEIINIVACVYFRRDIHILYDVNANINLKFGGYKQNWVVLK